ncbi:MAG: hypothetical protein ACRDZO_15650 [Egibacteraceae bacterium]
MTNHLRFLDGLYRDAPVSSYRRDLAAAVSEAAGLAAWLAMDMDDAPGAQRHYHDAIRAADAVQRAGSDTPVWPWLYPFSAHKLAAFSGSCHLRLGRAADAHAAFNEALRFRPAGTRDRATVLIDLTATHLTSTKPDVDEVCQLLIEAGGIAASTGSARMWREIRDGRTQLRPFRSSRACRTSTTSLRHWGAEAPKTRIGVTGHRGLPQETKQRVDEFPAEPSRNRATGTLWASPAWQMAPLARSLTSEANSRS